MPVSISGTNGVTFPDSSLQAAAASPYVLKNRIINGDMRIDQRNAGASVTSSAGNNIYPVDRFFNQSSSPAVFTLEQVEDAPVGFINSVVITVTTPDTSLAAGDFNAFKHIIEGLNVADFGWGTANAQSITLSFWVKSSLTGTFTVSFRNSAVNRSYIETYTISAANTWEQKTITIAGDTSGTWLTTNGIGIRLDWSLGSGSDFQGTAGSWTATNDITTSGATSVVGTNGATWYVTGVQLEQNTSATPFERRLYNQELANCQRYLPALNGIYWTTTGYAYAANTGISFITFPVTARTAPTGITFSSLSHFTVANSTNTSYTPTGIVIDVGNPAGTSIIWTTSTGLTSGTPTRMYASNASAQILFTGCEL